MIQLNLKPEIERFIDRQVAAGNYSSTAELVEAAVASLISETSTNLPPDELDELRAEIAVGLEQAKQGKCKNWDPQEIREEGRRLLEASKKRAG
jgi:putative addiction module CopG family antidote